MSEEVDAMSSQIAEAIPDYDDRFAVSVQLLAITLIRIRRIEAVGDNITPQQDQDLRGWLRTAKNLLETLGLTPLSDARLQLNRALTERTKLTDIPVRAFAEANGRASAS